MARRIFHPFLKIILYPILKRVIFETGEDNKEYAR
jgi:hypothetical protein